MAVYATHAEYWYDATDECPYCGAGVKIDYEPNGDTLPDELECPSCGRSMGLAIDWEPIFSLYKPSG